MLSLVRLKLAVNDEGTVARNWTIRGEYLYVNLESNSHRLARPIWHPRFHKGSLSLALIRARLSPMQRVAALR
jgi:hypothetical protein